MTLDFVSSLGDCLLAGLLDVVHHHHILDLVVTPVHVKYLGMLLYLGSYLIVVKVGRGKAYRVKHWFSLKSFEIEMVDTPQDTGVDLVFLARGGHLCGCLVMLNERNLSA